MGLFRKKTGQDQEEKKEKKEKKKLSPLARRIRLFVITGILVVILIFLLMFRLENIVVTGNDRYSDDEIKSLVLNEGSLYNTLFFCMVNKTIEVEDVPLLESIDVIYVDRNTIQLKANEKQTIGMFMVGDQVCCIDQDGRVIEILAYADSGSLNLPLIYNLASAGTVGEIIETDDYTVLNTLHALMNSFEKYGIMPNSINVNTETETAGDETIKTYTMYFGTIEVLLGPDEYLEEKMRRVAAILPNLTGMTGTLHLENYDEDTENIIFDTNTTDETTTEDSTDASSTETSADSTSAETEATDTTETTDSVETTESTEAADTAGTTESTEAADTADTTESTEAAAADTTGEVG